MSEILSAVRLPRLALAALARVAAELCAVGLMAAAAWLIARAAEQPPIAALGLAIVAVRAFALARGGFRYVERLAGHDVALRAVADLRSRLYEARLRHRAVRDGDVLARMVADVDCVQDLLLRCLLPASAAVVVGGASIALCGVLLPEAMVVWTAGLILAGIVVPAVVAAATRRVAGRMGEARATLATRSLDLVEGARELAAFGATDTVVDRAERDIAELARRERAAAWVSSTGGAAGILVQGVTAVVVTLIALNAGATEVVVAVLGLTALATFEAVMPLGDAMQRFVELRPAAQRVEASLNVRGTSDRSPRRTAEHVELQGVGVVYETPALQGIDLRIEPGRSVGIVGASGAGKSTLLELMAGLVEPDEGAATLPDARALTQDAHLFHATVRANLTLARPDATEEQLTDAACHAGLLDWIESLPARWDTVVGEGARALSGGQRQRLLLTRSVLSDAPVLLLDEPTEGVDGDIADAVLKSVLDARKGRTTVVITHRLTCLSTFDDVIVMDRGRIVQRGTHEQLVSQAGPYRELWEAELLVS